VYLKFSLFNNCQSQQMLTPDHRVSYVSSVGQHVSVITRPSSHP